LYRTNTIFSTDEEKSYELDRSRWTMKNGSSRQSGAPKPTEELSMENWNTEINPNYFF